MSKLIRLLISLVLTGLGYIVAKTFNVNPLFLVAPMIYFVIHTICWDVLKVKAFDNGFFKFIKFVVIMVSFVFLTLKVYSSSFSLITKDLFNVTAQSSDMYMLTVVGAVPMMLFSFMASFVCVENIGKRNLGFIVPVIGIVVGYLSAFVISVIAIIWFGLAKFLIYVLMFVVVVNIFKYVKENGLLYRDLALDAAFKKVSFKRAGGKPQKTGHPIQDAVNTICWSESNASMNLYHNNTMSIKVSASVYTSAIEFVINGTVYANSSNMNLSQVNDVNNQVNKILNDKKSRILKRAKRDIEEAIQKNPGYGLGYNISVKVGSINTVA